MSTPLSDIVQFLDSQLNTAAVRDASVALNGLQVENDGSVSSVALAVDASQKTLEDAVAMGTDLLIVHHGLYWSGLRPLTGWWKKKLCTCLNNNLAVYSSHLPLDLHPTLGNNACIAESLGLRDISPEVDMGGVNIGFAGEFDGTIGELRDTFAQILGGEVTSVIHDEDAPAGRVAICSGGGGTEIYQMQSKGYSCYITGEENHWVSNAAADMGMSILFGGHYATETFGVKALGKLLTEQFGLACHFIDNPTNM